MQVKLNADDMLKNRRLYDICEGHVKVSMDSSIHSPSSNASKVSWPRNSRLHVLLLVLSFKTLGFLTAWDTVEKLPFAVAVAQSSGIQSNTNSRRELRRFPPIIHKDMSWIPLEKPSKAIPEAPGPQGREAHMEIDKSSMTQMAENNHEEDNDLSLNRMLTEETREEDDNHCIRQDLFETDEQLQRVPTKTGMAFYLGSKIKPLRVVGMELSVNSDLGDPEAYDWRIRVYVSNNTYNEHAFDVDTHEYIKVADATAVLHPDGQRALIPAHAFHPVFFDRLQRRTMFIRAAGPWLKYTIDTFVKPKEQAIKGDFMTIFAGSPMFFYPDLETQINQETSGEENPFALPPSSPAAITSTWFDDKNQEFPVSLDPKTASIFSGKLHLEFERDICINEDGTNNAVTVPPENIETELEILHVVNATLGAPDYQRIEEAVNKQVDWILQNNPALSELVNTSQVRMEDSSKAFFRNYVGKCLVPDWILCNFLVVKVTLQHDDTVSSGVLKSHVYTHSISEFSRGAVLQNVPSTIGAAYVGLTTVTANFRMTIHGIPDNIQEMDKYQTDFLLNQLTGFLNMEMPNIHSQAFTMKLNTQRFIQTNNDPKTRGRRQLPRAASNAAAVDPRAIQERPGQSLELSGTITGGNIVFEDASQFATRVEEAVADQEAVDKFFAHLKYRANLPGPLSKRERYHVFEWMYSMSSDVDSAVRVQPGGDVDSAGNGPGDSSNDIILDKLGVDLWILALVAGVGSLIILLVCMWYGVRLLYQPSGQNKTLNVPESEPTDDQCEAECNPNSRATSLRPQLLFPWQSEQPDSAFVDPHVILQPATGLLPSCMGGTSRGFQLPYDIQRSDNVQEEKHDDDDDDTTRPPPEIAILSSADVQYTRSNADGDFLSTGESKKKKKKKKSKGKKKKKKSTSDGSTDNGDSSPEDEDDAATYFSVDPTVEETTMGTASITRQDDDEEQIMTGRNAKSITQSPRTNYDIHNSSAFRNDHPPSPVTPRRDNVSPTGPYFTTISPGKTPPGHLLFHGKPRAASTIAPRQRRHVLPPLTFSPMQHAQHSKQRPSSWSRGRGAAASAAPKPPRTSNNLLRVGAGPLPPNIRPSRGVVKGGGPAIKRPFVPHGSLLSSKTTTECGKDLDDDEEEVIELFDDNEHGTNPRQVPRPYQSTMGPAPVRSLPRPAPPRRMSNHQPTLHDSMNYMEATVPVNELREQTNHHPTTMRRTSMPQGSHPDDTAASTNFYGSMNSIGDFFVVEPQSAVPAPASSLPHVPATAATAEQSRRASMNSSMDSIGQIFVQDTKTQDFVSPVRRLQGRRASASYNIAQPQKPMNLHGSMNGSFSFYPETSRSRSSSIGWNPPAPCHGSTNHHPHHSSSSFGYSEGDGGGFEDPSHPRPQRRRSSAAYSMSRPQKPMNLHGSMTSLEGGYQAYHPPSPTHCPPQPPAPAPQQQQQRRRSSGFFSNWFASSPSPSSPVKQGGLRRGSMKQALRPPSTSGPQQPTTRIFPTVTPVSYTLSSLRRMTTAQLKQCLEAAGVDFDPRYIVEKDDLIRVFYASGKIDILPENTRKSSNNNKNNNNIPL